MENRPVPLLLLAIPVFFLCLGANSIWDANEAFYVETPRQMVLTGDYVNPSFNGEPRFNKPVLSYWIVAGLYHLLGVSVTTERLGIALGALGIVLATFLLGRALGTARTGALAALIVASSPRVVMHGRRIFIDVYITMFLAFALACFVAALRQPERRRRWLVLMYVAAGLAVLTKGPAFLALLGLILAVWLTVERRLGDLKRMMLLPGLLIVAAIVVPWYAAVYLEHGWTHITSFVFGENVGRFTTAMTPDGRGLAFFLPVLASDLFPWAPLLLLPLVTAWRAREPGEEPTHASIRRLCWCWIVIIVGAFSLSQTKEDLYIFPVVPAAAALIADTLIASSAGRMAGAVRLLIVVIGAIAVLLAGAGYWLFRDGYYALPHAAPAALVIGLAGLATLAFAATGRQPAALAAIALGFITFNYLFVTQILPDIERLKPAPVFARTFNEKRAPGALFAHLDVSLPSLVYYINQRVEGLGSTEQTEAYFRDAREERWLLLRDDHWRTLQTRAALPDSRIPPLCVKVKHPILGARIDELLHGTPPPDVFLVMNRCR